MNTNKFIKMCKANEDLQKGWDVHKKPMYDWIYFYDEKDKKYKIRLCTGLHAQLLYYIEHGKGYSSYEESIYIDFKKSVVKQLDRFTYLPTLEQLFEMVGDYRAQIDRPFLSILVMKKRKFKSMQELVLSAVMEIKYRKYWTGEKWYKK